MKFLLLFLACPLQAASLTVIADSPSPWAMTAGLAIRQHQAERGQACEVFTVRTASGVAVTATQETTGMVRGECGAVLLVDSSTVFAEQLASFLLRKDPLPGIGRPTELHFIGHGSSGGGFVNLLARLLPGKVDQVTTLDRPFAFSGDYSVPTNVVFADNYYQTNAATFFARGVTVAGAYNHQLITSPTKASENLQAWYLETIGTNYYPNGYYLVDCPHGARPAAGYRDRRVGSPTLRFSYDAGTRVLTESFGGGASGDYILETSTDFKTWTAGKTVYTFDGRPIEFDPLVFNGFVQPQLFVRLKSTL